MHPRVPDLCVLSSSNGTIAAGLATQTQRAVSALPAARCLATPPNAVICLRHVQGHTFLNRSERINKLEIDGISLDKGPLYSPVEKEDSH